MSTLFLSIFKTMALEIGDVDAIVMQEIEGETVVKYIREDLDPLDMEIAAAQWGLTWKMLAEARILPQRIVFVTARSEILIETLDTEFYLVVVLPPDGPLARAMRVVEQHLPLIHDEMGF